MSLQSLPGELVDEIILYTLPDGFESFVLSCKKIYGRANDRGTIARHNALKRRWKYTRISDGNGHGKLFNLIHDLTLDPASASYVEYLDLWDPHGVSDGLWQDIRGDNEAIERVKAVVLRSKAVQICNQSPEKFWTEMVDEDFDRQDLGQPTSVVFLLSLLPNLRTLQLPQSWALLQRYYQHAPPDWCVFLNALVRMSEYGAQDWDHYNLRETRYNVDALKNLTTILPFMPEGYDSRAALEDIEQFMPLKSLKELYLVSCIATEPDYYTGITFNWKSDNDRFSYLKRVEFAYCCMDADGISAFLSHVQGLEIFRYSHQTKWHGCQQDWNPGTFIEAIARHSGQTITDIAITVEQLLGDIINGASSFFSFPKLRRLECDVLIFRGPAVESGQRHGIVPYVPEGETPWDEDDIPCIGSMLPGGIEEMQLNTDFPKPDERTLNALLKNCREQRAARLIKLNKFIIRQWKDNDAKPLAERAGVDFEAYDHDGPEPVIRALMPQWKREFNAKVGGVILA